MTVNFLRQVNLHYVYNVGIIKQKMSIRFTGEDKKEFMERKQSYSNSPLQQQLFNQLILPPPYEFRHELFLKDSHPSNASKKMNQKAVSWLATVCWSKDLSQVCFWQATLLYYILKSKKKVQKQNLQLVLITCLNLSIKMNSSKAMTLKELSSCSKADSIQKIRQMQVVILELLDYNLFVPHYLSELFYCNIPQQQKHPLLFVCQLLIMKNCQLFFDKEKIQIIAEMLIKDHLGKLAVQEQICKEILETAGLKQSKIIINKYAPKFDIDAFLKKLTI